MKKTFGKIAFVLIVVMLACAVTGCELAAAVIAIPVELAIMGIEAIAEGIDYAIETPKEREAREKREKEEREWEEKMEKYKDVDTF